MGSLIAALNRTMDNAPTIPRDKIILLVTAIITELVTRAKAIYNDPINPDTIKGKNKL